MKSLNFRPGRAFLSVNSPTPPWTVVFEDEGVAAYFYACDRSQETQDHAILDAMLIYNVSALTPSDEDRIAAIEWSKDGFQAVLYLDGTPQALFDFNLHQGYSRMNFPNFIPEQGDPWNKADHAWSEPVFQRFESALYA